ncbi:MAG: hypothetical protein Tsb002_18080 [Wenzhouxiangellaceae bacterium]
MKNWWRQQSRRDQLIVIWGGSAAALLLFWALLWDPLVDARAGLRQQLSEQRATRLWLQQVEQMLLREPAATGAQTTPAEFQGSLLRLVDDSLRASGMAAAIERLEPDGSDQVRIWLRDADFDVMVGWLEQQAAQHGIDAAQAQISASDDGRVNARLLVRMTDAP